MRPDLSDVTSSVRSPRILIAESNFSTVESLLDTFRDRRLDFDFHLCTSHDGAMRKLMDSSYQVIISDVRLVEKDHFSLLRHAQAIETWVPFVITANTTNEQTRESARRVLEQGAFDLISLPPKSEQTENSIRVALWHSKLMNLIACKENAEEMYRAHLAVYPWGNDADPFLKRTLLSIQESIVMFKKSIVETEEFTALAMNVSSQARKRALERLDA